MQRLNLQQLQMLSAGMLPSTNRFLLGLISSHIITGRVEMRICLLLDTLVEKRLKEVVAQIRGAIR